MANYPLTDAYAAGLVDGEGCVSLMRSASSGIPRFTPTIEVGMTAKALAVLRAMEETFGGQIRRTRAATEKWDEAWTWGVFGESAGSVCRRLLPFLVLKSEQAEILLKFLDLRSALDPHPNGRGRWTTEAIRRAEDMTIRIRELNAKGPPSRGEPGWFARRVGDSWVTPQRSMFDDLGWEPFVGPWPRSGTTRNGIAYQRQPSVPLTSVIGSSSWPTPDTPNGGQRVPQDAVFSESGLSAYKAGKKYQVHLREAVMQREMWPTPRNSTAMAARITEDAVAKADGRFPNLETVVARRMWPTPRCADGMLEEIQTVAARDAYASRLEEAVVQEPARWRTPQGRDWKEGRSPVEHGYGMVSLPQQVGGRLNPMWVEWLMGFPLGWTDLEDSVTP